jgi:hypothetical protein
VKTPDTQCPGPTALLVEPEDIPQKVQGDPCRPESAAEGIIQMEYSDKLCNPSTGEVTKNYL